MPSGQLRRELGIVGAVVTGLGSILGTGVFVSLGLAAGLAGPWLIGAIVAAALVAMCNGLSSAQLAANHPVSGGTYEYGYRWLSPRLGFLAGWMFLWAKSASAATAALGLAGYLLRALGYEDHGLLVPIALTGLILLTAVVLLGIRRTVQANAAIVGTTLVALLAFIGFGMLSETGGTATLSAAWPRGNLPSVAEATALLFVAYTGYGRIATLGEEVKQPRRTIPIAVIVTLLVSLVLYGFVGWVAVRTVGAETFARHSQQTAAPLEAIAREFSYPGISIVMAVGAITAMGGVVLNLLLGLSRVVLAMGRLHDVPYRLAAVSEPSGVPWAATMVVAAIIGGIVCLGNVRLAWSFSAFTVLIYYALTNACALQLTRQERLYPPIVPWLGLVSCLLLAFWIDRPVWLFGTGLLVVGLFWHRAAHWLSRRRGKSFP